MKFTEEDLDACWAYQKSYLVEILNGEYSVEDAREDLESLIGSKWDNRIMRQNRIIQQNEVL